MRICLFHARRGRLRPSPYPATEEFDEYIRILPEQERTQNKHLDEIFLALVNNVKIEDGEFMSLTVEDPFFGRMTPITDVIGQA